MSKHHFTIQTHPWLVKYFASRNPVHLLVMITPTLYYFVKTARGSTHNLGTWVLMLALGVVWWTFLEYAIHRWAYHSKYPTKWMHSFFGSFHLYHHIDMSDRRVYNAGFLMVYLIAPVVTAPMWIITQSFSLTAIFGLGILSAYYFYEWVHFLLHYKVFTSGYFAWIQRYHFFHHEKRPDKNFGNTNAFWDKMLGTYDVNYKSYDLSDKAAGTMIVAQESSRDLRHA